MTLTFLLHISSSLDATKFFNIITIWIITFSSHIFHEIPTNFLMRRPKRAPVFPSSTWLSHEEGNGQWGITCKWTLCEIYEAIMVYMNLELLFILMAMMKIHLVLNILHRQFDLVSYSRAFLCIIKAVVIHKIIYIVNK